MRMLKPTSRYDRAYRRSAPVEAAFSRGFSEPRKICTSCGARQENTGKADRRHDGYGNQAVPQQPAVLLRVLAAVLEAHQRLGALRHTQHDVHHQRIGVGNDGIAHQPVGADAAEDHMVEEEDHHAVAQLRDTVRQSDGDQRR